MRYLISSFFALFISTIPNANSTIYSNREHIFKNDVFEVTLNMFDNVNEEFVEAYEHVDTDIQNEVDVGQAPHYDHVEVGGLKKNTVTNQYKITHTNTRKRRAVDTGSHRNSPISTVYDLHDGHTNALISWAGKTPELVALTKTSGGSQRSNLYVSRDFGKTFTNVLTSANCLCVTVGGVLKNASLDNLYHAAAAQDNSRSATSYVFTDKVNQLIVYTRDLQTFTTVHVDFQPTAVVFHPVREDVVIAYGTTRFSFSNAGSLYISYNFGNRWSLLKSNVHDFQWGWSYDQLIVSTPRYFGFGISDVKELTYDDAGIHERTLISSVQDFELKGSFLFAVKKVSLTNSSLGLNLFVSKNGSEFVQAQFPVIANYSNKEYYIVDADEDRVMVIVVHETKSSHLYVSDITGTRYTLSLPNIVYMSSTSSGGTALPGLRYYDVPVADIHKVDGLRGIYIASQFLTNKSLDTNLADVNQTTRITYDKGGEWTHIGAPYRDMNGSHTHCYWDFIFGKTYRAAPILSSSNAIGLVMGSGVFGYTLKQDTNPSVFLSGDAGFTWKEVAKGHYTYSFGDHGNLIVMVPSRKLTTTLLYSHNEGDTWNEYQFTESYNQIKVYGLLTEPGSQSANFSLWGSRNGTHSWVVIHLNLRNIFNSTCVSSDYKSWHPGVNVSYNEICLLGEQEVIERKKKESFCFNGKDYKRARSSKICKCIQSDYECDYGYIKVNETEDFWDPTPVFFYSNSDMKCVRDTDVAKDTMTGKPDFCPYGTNYAVTRGYRKIPGDVCQGGEDHLYDRIHRNCPRDNKTDFLLYSSGVNIYRYDLKTQKKEFVLRGSSVSEIYSVEFDYNKDIIYWADRDSDSVKYYNVSSPTATIHTLISGNTGKIECISLDWESDNIYLVDSRTPKIEILTTVTHYRRTIVQNNQSNPNILENPRALDVFPMHGLMFWTDWADSNPRVMRAAMSGYNPMVVISRNTSGVPLRWPNGLAVDFDNEMIYIADGSAHTIITCDLHGHNAKTALSDANKLQHPFSLTLLKGRLYWSDWQDKKIKSVFRDTFDGYYTVLTSYDSRIMSVKAMNWDKQYKAGTTGCGGQNGTNGGCSSICVPHPHVNFTISTNRVCLCSDDTKPLSYINGSTEQCACTLPRETFNAVSGRCERGKNSTCANGTFSCHSVRGCIPLAWQCDGDGDCSDNSDEIDCDSKICEHDQFLCKANQKCITKDWVCDGQNDCADGDDEKQHCNTTCSDTLFTCDNHVCLPKSYQCDGQNDCGLNDFSDETRGCIGHATTPAQEVTCGPSKFRCNSTRYGLPCIPNSWKCDKEPDCDDHSDENPLLCNSTCTDYEFKCANSTDCIPQAWQCDAYNDCSDKSDEASCATTPVTTAARLTSTPPPSWCICRNDAGRCVTYNDQCDGRLDCSDGRDEWGCSYNYTTTGSTRPCLGFSCTDGRCLSTSQVCDGRNDCFPIPDDERNCRNGSCAIYQVRCALSIHQCINKTQRCDGKWDCFMGTDEQGCTTAAPTDCHGQFQCNSSKICIEVTSRCNEHWDCDDGSDEQNCNKNVTIAGFKRTGKTATSASFQWTSNSSPTITVKYLIQYTYVADVHSHLYANEWMNGTVTAEKNGTVSRLQPYTNYKFIVRALVINGDEESLGRPSKLLMLSTSESVSSRLNKCQVLMRRSRLLDSDLDFPPGMVSNVRAQLDMTAEVPGHWILSWNYPVHPNGRITAYHYEVTMDQNMYDIHSAEVEAKGTESVSVKTYIHTTSAAVMEIKVWAINGAGRGDLATVTHCLELVAPSVHCAYSSINSITVNVQTNQDLASVYSRYEYHLRMNYIDLDGIPQRITVPVYESGKDYALTATGLGSGAMYDITVEVERWPSDVIHHDADRPTCVSAVKRVACSTTGDAAEVIQDLRVIGNATKSSFNLAWGEVKGATKYQIVLAYGKDELEEGHYARNFTSPTSQVVAKDLLSCQMYVVAVRVEAPLRGQLSNVKMVMTKKDDYGAPRLLRASAHSDGVLSYRGSSWHTDYYYDSGQYSDPVNTTISWKPPCYSIVENSTVYITEYSVENGTDYPGVITQNVSEGVNVVYVMLERGGAYKAVVQNDRKGGKTSNTLKFSPAPYEAPEFYLDLTVPTNATARDIYFNMTQYFSDGKVYLRRQTSVMINIEYSVDGGAFQDTGNRMFDGYIATCGIPSIEDGVTYTVRIRFLRSYQGRLYHGEFGTFILPIGAPRVDASASTSGHSRVGMYVGVGVSVSIVLVLSVLLGVWCVRHRRLQRSFLDFTSSHYNTRTDNATFNTDDDDAPLIQGFSDDEPLVIA